MAKIKIDGNQKAAERLFKELDVLHELKKGLIEKSERSKTELERLQKEYSKLNELYALETNLEDIEKLRIKRQQMAWLIEDHKQVASMNIAKLMSMKLDELEKTPAYIKLYNDATEENNRFAQECDDEMKSLQKQIEEVRAVKNSHLFNQYSHKKFIIT